MTTPSAVAISVNGHDRVFDRPLTVAELISELGLVRSLVALEINREIVRRTTFDQRQITDGDQIEVVEFVGGG